MSAIPTPAPRAASPMKPPKRPQRLSGERSYDPTKLEQAIAARCAQTSLLAKDNERDAHELHQAKSSLERLRHRIGTLGQRLAERSRRGFVLTQQREVLEQLSSATSVVKQVQTRQRQPASNRDAQPAASGIQLVAALTDTEAKTTETSQATWQHDCSRVRNKLRRMRVTMGETSASNFYVGFAGTVHSGGVFVATYHALPRGTMLDAEIELPSVMRPVRCIVQVAWVNEYCEGQNEECRGSVPGIGFRFFSIDATDKEAIETFMRSREPLFFPEDELWTSRNRFPVETIK